MACTWAGWECRPAGVTETAQVRPSGALYQGGSCADFKGGSGCKIHRMWQKFECEAGENRGWPTGFRLSDLKNMECGWSRQAGVSAEKPPPLNSTRIVLGGKPLSRDQEEWTDPRTYVLGEQRALPLWARVGQLLTPGRHREGC